MTVLEAIQFHEAANIFPMMGDDEYRALVADIRAKGLLEPIWTYQGKIIDGRNRDKACVELGIEPRYRECNGEGSLVAFVVSLNLQRRHLSSSQKAVIALEVEDYLAEEAEKRMLAGKSIVPGTILSQGRSAHQAAAITGTSGTYVKEAKKIVEKAPELKTAILTGTMTIPEAKRQLKEQAREQRRDENRETIAQAHTIEEALGGARFATIVVDSPWDWGDEGDGEQMGRAMPVYGTMPLEELLALPVGRYADEDCHLYLWTTNRSLPKGFRLLETWGFRYVICITWVKPSFGMGNYFRGQTEHLLFGVKGSQLLKRKDASTYFEAPRGPNGHSS